MMDTFGPQGTYFDAGSSLFAIIFFIIFGIIIFNVVKGVNQWHENEQSPRLSVPVTITTKRTNVDNHMHHGNMHTHTTSSTTYFVTVTFASGDRSEFHITGEQYGLLAEGDTGILTFQGSRFLDFKRNNL
ncbi:DUF2500 domain-containing protein [Virgibacillus soli]|uniref:DUF2500 domain-containing protein n=1 Tax=Paracerasibacillus soli TaxID=480284 RepID=A0ABU5CRV1_9BACI|nr:DUF2500 domain-containing protein [Virgibacillus soli]MDY0409099.1 DUF2500 domain-containing protein [Virgibacillus soli]